MWAVGYDDIGRANEVRDKIVALGWDKHYLQLDDVAVVARHVDGSFTLDRQAFPVVSNVIGSGTVGLLVGLVLGGPLVGATVGAIIGSAARPSRPRLESAKTSSAK